MHVVAVTYSRPNGTHHITAHKDHAGGPVVGSVELQPDLETLKWARPPQNIQALRAIVEAANKAAATGMGGEYAAIRRRELLELADLYAQKARAHAEAGDTAGALKHSHAAGAARVRADSYLPAPVYHLPDAP